MRIPSAAALLLVLAALAPAQTTSAPSSKPDLSSPRLALTSLYTAMRNGDIAAAGECMLFQDQRHAETFELSLAQVWGPMRLMRAMETRFGQEAGRKPFANASLQKSVDDLLEKVKHVEFQIDGATATVSENKAAINPSAENELTGITLQRTGNSWKIVAATFSDASSDVPPAQLDMMRSMRTALERACDGTLARLARGDFKTADQAYADYQARLKSGIAR
jgi:hypothetical protein